MTGKIYEFLGHKMLIEADGKALTRCHWIPSDIGMPDFIRSSTLCQNTSEEETEMIDMAVVQISEYLEGKRKEFTVPLRLIPLT